MLNVLWTFLVAVTSMHVKPRFPERIEYQAASTWDGKTGGTATASGNRPIRFDTPVTYGGRGEGICPDELFVCAVLGCLNNTFLDFRTRFEMELVSLNLSGKTAAVFERGAYLIRNLQVSGEVVVGKGELATGQRCLELMKEYCHLARTISSCISIEFDVKVREGQD
jgi:organic hydroperoxide reductase OsmC/OhrA